MASVSSVLDYMEGTSPLAVIELLSGTLLSWDPKACYFQQALLREHGTGDDPQPFYACSRALDAVMGESLLEEFPRGFLQYSKEAHREESNISYMVSPPFTNVYSY
jgi:hypothetical protein